MKKILILIGVFVITLTSCKKEAKLSPTLGQGPKPDFIELSAVDEAVHIANGKRLSQALSGDSVILLDFDGETVSGTSWNVNGPIYAQPSLMAPSDQQLVVDQVKERYSTYNVIVTTDSALYWAATSNRRMRCIITPTSSWYGSAGGVAFVHSFIWGDNTPCWVFDALLNENVHNVAVSAAHEVGHTLGLRHQAVYDANCILVSQYRGTTGTGVTSWAPTMGVAYSASLWTFTIGVDVTNCTNMVNEYDTLNRTYNNTGTQLSNRPDVVVNSLPTDIVLYNGGQYNGSLEYPSDVDFFQVGPHANVYGIHVTVATYGTTDIAVDVYDNRGNLRQTIDPGGNPDVPRWPSGGIIAGWAPQWVAVRNTSNNSNVPAGSFRGSYKLTVEY